MKPKLLIAVSILALSGCTDTIDSVTREYRNTNNETIDALMMVTDEESAKRLKMRVFDRLPPRYQDIDGRLKNVVNNRTKSELIKEVFESDGFLMYWNEVNVNTQRLGLENARLNNLLSGYEKEERDRLDAEGKFDVQVNLRAKWPNLVKVREVGLALAKFFQTESEALGLLGRFAEWKVEGYDNMLRNFEKRTKVFLTDVPQLVN